MAFNLFNFQTPQQQYGGLLGNPSSSAKGLLGGHFDPEEMRRQKIFGAMSAAGAALLQGGQGNFGQVIGQGMAGAAQGAQQAGQNYRNDAMLYSQMGQQNADRERQIGQQNTEMGWKLEDRAKADARAMEAERLKTNQTKAIMDWASAKPPEFQAWAQQFPEEAAKVYSSEMAPVAGKPTDDISEYNYAKSQGYPGSFTEYMVDMKKAGAQNITVGGGKYGTIPPGYELLETPQGAQLKPIAGGPAALEAEGLKTKADIAAQNKGVSADIVTQDIDRAISSLDAPGILPKTGLGAETLKSYGGTGAADLKGLLDSIEANVGFDALAQMRAASPTGGALGAITERELALLAATKGAITQSQSKEQLKYNLNRLWNVTQDIVHGPNAGPPRRPLGAAGQGGSIDLKQKYGLE